MFDRVEISVRAGDGGDGAITFRKEKFVPRGGPEGGDGGDGGDLVIRADPATDDLRLFRHKGQYRAVNGGRGGPKKRHGKRGEDLVLAVPLGTEIRDNDSGVLIADLEESGEEVLVGKGGRGGWGNIHFASPTNQVPRIAQKGEEGEKRSLVLELKLIADAGIVGYPNVGKSTLLAAVSAAHPKIANYPFTTREPVLGAVEVNDRRFVLAEIPGLIDGAHLGRGLGHDFLCHIVRTRLIVHLVDGTSAEPVADVQRLNNELRLFDSSLMEKPQIVAVNKIDLLQVRERKEEVRAAFAAAGIKVRFVSAQTGEGIPELVNETLKRLEELGPVAGAEKPPKVFRPRPRGPSVRVTREADGYALAAPDFERLIARTGLDDPEVKRQIMGEISRQGISQLLEKAGARPGDGVRCGQFQWRL